MKLRHLMTVVALLLSLVATAQRRSRVVQQKPQEPSPEVLAQQERLQRMTMATQRILFVDSVVVDKTDFLQHYYLNPEEGGRIDSYNHFFRTDAQAGSYLFQNALGNRCVFSLEDADGNSTLYSSETENRKWTSPDSLKGVNDEQRFFHVNYPFMLTDGVTLYFAAEGDESLGGYDIFVTTYDAEEGRFLQPENIGMPFNSEANDYLYVVDEYDNIGWFATDRRQPDGKVCIYTFVPSDVRRTYDPEQYSEEEIAAFARIDNISSTWESPAREEALTRLQNAKNPRTDKHADDEFTFVINELLDYHRLNDFQAPGNSQRYLQLVQLRNQYLTLCQVLDKARDYYSKASDAERTEMRQEMMAGEQQQLQLAEQVRSLEKTIRNEENRYLLNKQ